MTRTAQYYADIVETSLSELTTLFQDLLSQFVEPDAEGHLDADAIAVNIAVVAGAMRAFANVMLADAPSSIEEIAVESGRALETVMWTKAVSEMSFCRPPAGEPS